MKLKPHPDGNRYTATCDHCKQTVTLWRGVAGGDVTCSCGAIYNAFGQRLRDDLYTRPNPSADDENIGDMEGDEMSYAARERQG
jgi:hypothetical protein